VIFHILFHISYFMSRYVKISIKYLVNYRFFNNFSSLFLYQINWKNHYYVKKSYNFILKNSNDHYLTLKNQFFRKLKDCNVSH